MSPPPSSVQRRVPLDHGSDYCELVEAVLLSVRSEAVGVELGPLQVQLTKSNGCHVAL
jgi:hypothetical protein